MSGASDARVCVAERDERRSEEQRSACELHRAVAIEALRLAPRVQMVDDLFEARVVFGVFDPDHIGELGRLEFDAGLRDAWVGGLG